MAYYAALLSVIQLLQDIVEIEDRDEIHSSLYQEFRALKNSLEDYSPEDRATADAIERRIRDAAYAAQYIIETEMSNPGHEDYFDEELWEVKSDVSSIMEELMMIKLSYTYCEDHSAESAGASTSKDGPSAVRSKLQDCANQLSEAIQILQNKIHGDSHPGPLPIRYKEQITSLIEKLSQFQELLHGYSQKHIDKETYLDRRIAGATHKANRISKSNVLKENVWRKYCESLKKVKQEVEFITRETMQSRKPKEYQKLKKVMKVVGSVVKSLTPNRDKLQSICYSANNAGASTQASNFEDSTVGASKMRAVSGKNALVGLDGRLMTTIKGQLCGEPSKVQVVSIVGMGGVGKTTWARYIFDDKLICEKFDCRAWFTVSQDHDLRKILLGIVSSLNMNNIEELHGVGKQVLKDHIYRHLFGRRYFIIMDDVWDTKFWDDIKRIFPDVSNGSRVMITARESDVAYYASTSDFIHHIPLLDELQSWYLFCDRVLCPPELEDIGRSIASRCRGLPLAIVVIARLLSKSSMTKYDWEKIETNLIRYVAKDDEHFSRILFLSYNFMPHHLKPCFLHLGGFPEDCQIQASQLIKLWVAEGFIEPTESKSLEEVAEGYLEDLVDRNLVYITKRNSSGKIKYCNIHDLLRDLCLEKSREENFLFVINKDLVLNPEQRRDVLWGRFLFGTSIEEKFLDAINKNVGLNPEHIRNVRRLHICHPGYSIHFGEFKNYPRNVRSVYFFTDVGDRSLSVASNFKRLRVLNAVGAGRSESPDEIVNLLDLRYLGLPYLHVSPSISKIQNLETLVLGGDQTILPSEIWNMQHLRHVIIRQMILPPAPQVARIIRGVLVPLLGRLQTLSTVVDFIFTGYTVAMIPYLKKLKVFYNEAFKSWDALGLDNLVRLSQLETLHIEIYLGESNMNIPVQPLPQNFGLADSLKKLSLSGCRLPWRDMTVLGSLPNLQVLKLRLDAFLGEEWESIEGQFLKLKFLLMEKLLYLKEWKTEKNHFPRLERLIIRDCQRLQEIPSDIGDISTLQLIEVYGSGLAADSALKIQEEQKDNGNDVLQVHV